MFNLWKKKKVEEPKEESLIEHYRHKSFKWKEPKINKDEIVKQIFQRDFSLLMPKKNGKAVAMDSQVCNCSFKGENIPDDILKFYGSQYFIGWQACALLRQNPYIDKACTIPAQDAISPDYKISYVENTDNKSENDEEKLAEMKAISDKDYNIKDVCYRANVNKKTFGISLVVPVVDGVNYEKPYNIEAVKKGSYKGMTVVEPYWTAPRLDSNAVSNPMNTGFQEPTWWRMPNGTLIHKSWCIKRCNSELPDILKPTYYYGGVPLTQKIYERVYAAEKVANEAPLLALTKRMLVVDANIENLVANEEEVQKTINMAQYYRDNFSLWFKNPDDDIKQIDTSLTDFDSLVMTQYQLVACIADMPATKLLKTQPKGFNATGEYEQKDYIQSLQAIQEQDFIPILRMHYELFTKSFYGEAVDLAIVFNPIDTPSEKDTAEVAKIWSDVDSNYIAAGVMSAEEVRDVRRSQDDSPYSALADDIEGDIEPSLEQAADEALDGGVGSGNFNHAGRPDEVGGSLPKGSLSGIPDYMIDTAKSYIGHSRMFKQDMNGFDETKYNKQILEVLQNPVLDKPYLDMSRDEEYKIKGEIFNHILNNEQIATPETLMFYLYAKFDGQTSVDEVIKKFGLSDIHKDEIKQMLNGLSINYPDFINYSDTLGLDVITLKQARSEKENFYTIKINDANGNLYDMKTVYGTIRDIKEKYGNSVASIRKETKKSNIMASETIDEDE
jgi:phage-related protein (TIGR01555 family)